MSGIANQSLQSEPFMRSAKATGVDLEGWACEVMEKITGKPHVRNRSSMHVILPKVGQARPVSRIDGPAPSAPRRPSAPTSEATGRRPSAAEGAMSPPAPKANGDRERDREAQRLHAYRQASSGMAGR